MKSLLFGLLLGVGSLVLVGTCEAGCISLTCATANLCDNGGDPDPGGGGGGE